MGHKSCRTCIHDRVYVLSAFSISHVGVLAVDAGETLPFYIKGSSCRWVCSLHTQTSDLRCDVFWFKSFVGLAPEALWVTKAELQAIGKLQSACDKQDLNALGDAAHNVKGASAAIGFEDCRKLAEELEVTCRQSGVKSIEITDFIHPLLPYDFPDFLRDLLQCFFCYAVFEKRDERLPEEKRFQHAYSFTKLIKVFSSNINRQRTNINIGIHSKLFFDQN